MCALIEKLEQCFPFKQLLTKNHKQSMFLYILKKKNKHQAKTVFLVHI